MLNVDKNQQNRQTESRNLMGPKTLPTIWGTYVKLVTKYQIYAIFLVRFEVDNDVFEAFFSGYVDRRKLTRVTRCEACKSIFHALGVTDRQYNCIITMVLS
jgi:hypothetical protein